MNRLLTTTAVTVLLGLTPALAADTSADTSSGAKVQSSAPPSSGAAEANKPADGSVTSADPSTGAKEQSSAPEGSSAADKSKPNPSLGASQMGNQDSMTKSGASKVSSDGSGVDMSTPQPSPGIEPTTPQG